MDRPRSSLTGHADMADATLCAHAGHPRAPTAPRPHVTPLYQTSVFDFPSIPASEAALAGEGYVYCRNGLPNPDELGAAVAALEGAEAGVATSSGMSAIVAAVLVAARAGDRVVVQRDAYGGSLDMLRDLERFGIEITTVDPGVDPGNPDALARALAGASTALVESISNPLLRQVDLPAMAALCRRHGVRLICDNTFATPLRDRPLAQGADLVVHSATKFLGGHDDLGAGVVLGAREPMARVRSLVTRMGLGAAPLDAWLAVRGLRTLDVRMQRAWTTTAALAERLRAHSTVQAVHTAPRCALICIDLGDLAGAGRFVEGLDMITLSPSLGGVTTTASHPASSSHRDIEPEARAAAGIGDGLVRLSIGIEAEEDIWRDLAQALG